MIKSRKVELIVLNELCYAELNFGNWLHRGLPCLFLAGQHFS